MSFGAKLESVKFQWNKNVSWECADVQLIAVNEKNNPKEVGVQK